MSASVAAPADSGAVPSLEQLAAENAAANRRSSASSASSDLNDHGMPVQPYRDEAAPAVAHAGGHQSSRPHHHELTIKPPSDLPSTSESEPSSVSETSTLEPSVAHTATAAATGPGLRLALQSPTGAAAPATGFSFEEVMSPRHQNGKRYLGGYLTHRVSMAGGFLKSWKRKYFRLRDHGVVCFKNAEDTAPLFELHFRAQSLVVVERALGGGGSSASTPTYEDPSMLASTKGKVNASLVLILKHVDVVGHLTPANKVDVPVFLKAENETEFHAWVENVRLKIEARKRALAQDAVNATLDGAANDAPPSNRSGSIQGKSGANPPPALRPRQASAGESVSFSERHGSAHGLQDDLSPSGVDTRVASMNSLSSPLRSAGVTPTNGTDARSKLLFVAGAVPDPAEFATFRSKYLLMKEIGEGSFSIVHRAVNRLTGQLCAVKCCKYSHALEEEVAIMRRLSHPNLVALEGVYLQDDMYYVVMDYMEEGDLCERLIQKQRFTESEAKLIIVQVLRGLDHLHRNNVLHRDLKPENILLHGEVVKIADFGLARQLPSATSMLKRSCGTLEYAAPELLRGQAYGLKSDIFSLGVVLYVLLFGAFPFTIESAAALQRMERFPEGVDVRDMSCLHRDNAQWRQVSSMAQDVLLRMLCPNDKERISAKDLLAHPWFNSAQPTSPSDGGSFGVRRDTGLLLQDLNAEEREAERVRDCRAKGFIELLSRGLDVIKYAKTGNTSPHLATISVDFVRGTISWTARGGVLGLGGTTSNRKVTDTSGTSSPAKRGARVLSFSDVQEIRVGHTTEAFRAIASGGRDPPPADTCVSIIGTWRTLDFVVKACTQREYVVSGLKIALEQYRNKHKQP